MKEMHNTSCTWYMCPTNNTLADLSILHSKPEFTMSFSEAPYETRTTGNDRATCPYTIQRILVHVLYVKV